MKGVAYLGLSVLAFSGCSQKQDQSSKAKAILGESSRLLPTDNPTLRSTVGYLLTSDGSRCTAFVTGEKEITTAAHCRGKNADAGKIDATFTRLDGKNIHLSKVTRLETKKDYLVLESDESFSSKLEVSLLSGQNVSIVGYDFDKGNLYTQENCTVDRRLDSAGVFLHSCDSLSGFSGGPILQNGKVVGLHIGYQEKVDRNVAFDFAKLWDDSVDVAEVGVKDECLFDCHIRMPKPPSLSDIFGGLTNSIKGNIAADVANQAQEGGWTRTSCPVVGAGAILLPAATYIAPACAASGFITAGIGVPACVGAVSGSIVGAVCYTLCDDHRLADCK